MSKRIGIMANTEKGAAIKLCAEVVAWLKKRRIEFVVDGETAKELSPPFKRYAVKSAAELRRVEILVTLGGDGFLLHCARILYPCRCAFLPVNLGSLGFNALFSAGEVYSAIEQTLQGKLKIQSRFLLSAAVVRDGNKVFNSFALNEVLVSKTATSRIINIELRVAGEFATVYRGDGVIVSTPTGSTAYNLAVGGPVVHPEMKAIIVVALCPHSLTQRALILPASQQLELVWRRGKEREETMVMLDGQQSFDLSHGDRVQVSGARQPLKIFTISTGSYFKSLREKLHWGREE